MNNKEQISTQKPLTSNDENRLLQTFRQMANEDQTYAQQLYDDFVKQAYQNLLDEQELKNAKTERERVELKQNRIKEKALEHFGNLNDVEIFFQELKNQQKNKQQHIKEKALKEGITLWHASPLSKEELDGGVLKGTTERPDLAWEKVFTGVCAFPHSNGAYSIKKAKDERNFACKGENLVILTDNRLDGKKDDEILGYIYGHKLTENDGFTPTVSLNGTVCNEWTSEKEISIDEIKEVTLKSLKKNNVHIFSVDKKDMDFLREMNQGKTFEQQTQLLEYMSSHPNRIYKDKDNNLRKIKVMNHCDTSDKISVQDKIASLRTNISAQQEQSTQDGSACRPQKTLSNTQLIKIAKNFQNE